MKKRHSSRGVKTNVKTAKGRKISSTLWLKRQLNDPYVQRARKDGYRSRAAYKILELDDQFHFFAKGKTVVDLGAAPGGWTQVAVARCGKNTVVAMDILEMGDIEGAIVLHKDFTQDDAPELLKRTIEERWRSTGDDPAKRGGASAEHERGRDAPRVIDIVISDMAPNATGHVETDHIRIMLLVELAVDFAIEVLKPGGWFVAKVWQGGTESEALKRLKKHFVKVKHAKPNASRKDSAETFVIAQGFRK